MSRDFFGGGERGHRKKNRFLGGGGQVKILNEEGGHYI